MQEERERPNDATERRVADRRHSKYDYDVPQGSFLQIYKQQAEEKRRKRSPIRRCNSSRDDQGVAAKKGFDNRRSRQMSLSRDPRASARRDYNRSQSCGPVHKGSASAPRGGAPPASDSPTTITPDFLARRGQTPRLNLYHVSQPEPRARWMFDRSRYGAHKVSKPPEPPVSAPARVTSMRDETRPSLGGLVWLNATLGGHCCLQKGTNTKTVTEIPAQVLDGWLNGQTGYWWIGAVKEGHRTLWHSHTVVSWAMVFVPSSPEIATRNNMEVWRDKCLMGSLRVVRPGELERKIADIVADDQDAEPDSTVHTHLCILLADGDDLELNHPRIRCKMPRPPGEPSNSGRPPKPSPFVSNGSARIRAPSPAGDWGQGWTAPRSVENADSSGDAPRPAESAGTGRRGSFPGTPGATTDGAGELRRNGSWACLSLEEALEKAGRYRDRIRTLKDDRQADKAMLAHLRQEVAQKEEKYVQENERLRQERNALRTKAKVLRMDLKTLQREKNSFSAVSSEEAKQLQFDVERLRRERDDARAEAMSWLEHEKAKIEAAGQAAFLADRSQQTRELGSEAHSSASNDHHSPNGNSHHAAPPPQTLGRSGAGGAPEVEGDDIGTAAAAAVIAKLRAKVERLRRERDDAEEAAAKWLNEQQEKLKLELAEQQQQQQQLQQAASSDEPAGAGGGAGPGADHHPPTPSGSRGLVGSQVVAGLRAESAILRKELAEARSEAQRLKDKVATAACRGGGIALTGISGSLGLGGLAGLANLSVIQPAGHNDTSPWEASEQAKKALGQLLGKALNLLSPKAAAEAAAEVAAKAAANAEAAVNAQAGANAVDNLAESKDASSPSTSNGGSVAINGSGGGRGALEGWGPTARKNKEEQEETATLPSTANNSPMATTAAAAQTPPGQT